MSNLKASSEFKVGSHSIGWVDSDFTREFGSFDFVPVASVGTFQTLPRYMTDSEITSELKPGTCTLGDVLAFLQNPPEGTKDGNWNIFYVRENPSFVVCVFWFEFRRVWRVSAYARGGNDWYRGTRVFSPANVSSGTESSSDSQTLEPSVLDPMERIAAALERIATVMERPLFADHLKSGGLETNDEMLGKAYKNMNKPRGSKKK